MILLQCKPALVTSLLKHIKDCLSHSAYKLKIPRDMTPSISHFLFHIYSSLARCTGPHGPPVLFIASTGTLPPLGLCTCCSHWMKCSFGWVIYLVCFLTFCRFLPQSHSLQRGLPWFPHLKAPYPDSLMSLPFITLSFSYQPLSLFNVWPIGIYFIYSLSLSVEYKPHENSGFCLFCLLLMPQSLEQCLTHSEASVNITRMKACCSSSFRRRSHGTTRCSGREEWHSVSGLRPLSMIIGRQNCIFGPNF